MKRKGIFVGLLVLVAMGFAACGTKTAEVPPETMYIEQADVPKYGQHISQYEHTGTWRYSLDDSIQWMEMKKYNLGNGKWYELGGTSGDVLGRDAGVAIGYDDLRGGWTAVIGGGVGSSEPGGTYETDLYRHVFWLEGWETIEDGVEIPLTMQILDDKEEIEPPSLDLFFDPETLNEMDFDSVMVATVVFSSEKSE